MIRKLCTLLLLSGILLQVFNKLLIYADYNINKTYITKNLCENKSKPYMHCEGRCHLKKQLDEQEKNSNLPVNNIISSNEILLFFNHDEIKISNFPVSNPLITFFIVGKTSTVSRQIFHPPLS